MIASPRIGLDSSLKFQMMDHSVSRWQIVRQHWQILQGALDIKRIMVGRWQTATNLHTTSILMLTYSLSDPHSALARYSLESRNFRLLRRAVWEGRRSCQRGSS